MQGHQATWLARSRSARGMVSAESPLADPASKTPAAGTALVVLDQRFDEGTLYLLRAAVLAHAVATGMPEQCARDVVSRSARIPQVRKARRPPTEHAGTLGVISPSHCSRSRHGAGEDVSSARGLFRSW